MHEMRAILGVLCLLSFPLAPGAVAQPQEPAPQSTDARQSTPPTLLALRGVIVSTASLLGSKVKNLSGENVGTVQHLLINPRTGRVFYAVVSIGGFLGMGEKALIVPWPALEVARDDSALGTHHCTTIAATGAGRGCRADVSHHRATLAIRQQRWLGARHAIQPLV